MKNKDTLCLIDDDIIHQFIIKKLVSGIHTSQKKLLVFSNGEEGINYLRSNTNYTNKLPDLILLDLNMPIMDGWQFLNEYEKIYPTLKKDVTIYILSSSNNPKDIEKAQDFEKVSGYLTKPISELELEDLICNF